MLIKAQYGHISLHAVF